MSDLRDVVQGHKDVLHNFAKWMREQGKSFDDSLIEPFLSTQHAGPRHVPHCSHCGGLDVTSADFKDRPLRKVREGDGLVDEKRDPSEHGPAWMCACGAWTQRSS